MCGYRLRLRFRSACGTPLQADTIFGHLCWALRYLQGEDRLQEFLSAFHDGTPLVLSDGLPCVQSNDKVRYFLPAPAFPLLSHSEVKEVLAELGESATKENLRAAIGALKVLKNLKTLEDEVILENRSHLSAKALLADLIALTICPRDGGYNEGNCPLHGEIRSDGKVAWRKCPAFEQEEAVRCEKTSPEPKFFAPMHNMVNRLQGGTVEGMLFTAEEWWPSSDYAVYLLLDQEVMTWPQLEECFEFVGLSGYGRDKSVGKGAFDLIGVEEFLFPPLPEADALLCLSSSCVPQNGEPRRGFVDMHVKRGKLGGGYVHSKTVWKRPVIMARAGSVLICGPGQTSPWVGGLVHDVHADPKIVQYGICYALPVKLEARQRAVAEAEP